MCVLRARNLDGTTGAEKSGKAGKAGSKGRESKRGWGRIVRSLSWCRVVHRIVGFVFRRVQVSRRQKVGRVAIRGKARGSEPFKFELGAEFAEEGARIERRQRTTGVLLMKEKLWSMAERSGESVRWKRKEE